MSGTSFSGQDTIFGRCDHPCAGQHCDRILSKLLRSKAISGVHQPVPFRHYGIAMTDWKHMAANLAAHGYATLSLLDSCQCRELAALYDDDTRFRSRVVMQQHNYGRGEYKYLAYPLPDLVASLRAKLYPPLAEIANKWGERKFPPTLDAYLAECHAGGQTRPTPLLLRYGPDDFNCLHQDLYGPLVFPLQLTVLLSQPGKDFFGGEFVLVEQRPRAQSRPAVVPLSQGEAVIFPVHHRPVDGARGTYRVTMRHGVSRVFSGRRQTLGIIFHDAA